MDSWLFYTKMVQTQKVTNIQYRETFRYRDTKRKTVKPFEGSLWSIPCVPFPHGTLPFKRNRPPGRFQRVVSRAVDKFFPCRGARPSSQAAKKRRAMTVMTRFLRVLPRNQTNLPTQHMDWKRLAALVGWLPWLAGWLGWLLAAWKRFAVGSAFDWDTPQIRESNFPSRPNENIKPSLATKQTRWAKCGNDRQHLEHPGAIWHLESHRRRDEAPA